jgi:soluble lytic murein transglycosylase
MNLRTILASLAVVLAGAVQAQSPNQARDEVLLEMQQAFRQGNKARLAQLLPQAQGHALEPWAVYWELRNRLDTAPAAEIQQTLARLAGTYQEDRLRNDWLQLLGQRREWDLFAQEYPKYRMRDDREVRCYALLTEALREGANTTPAVAEEVRRLWLAQREADDGCTTAAAHLIETGHGGRKLGPMDAWRKARQATEANRPRVAAAAVEIAAKPEALKLLAELNAAPSKFLLSKVTAVSRTRRELVSLALIKLATGDVEHAAGQLESKWGPQMNPEERDWVWGVIGHQAALRLDPNADAYYARVGHDKHLSDELLQWKVRAALRAPRGINWKSIQEAIDAMSDEARADPAWTYWRARALATGRGEQQRAEARKLLEGIASPRGFYEQLALEELGQKVTVPAKPAPLTEEETRAARQDPALNRALYAIAIGLRPEGTREWNYTTNLHRPGGLGDRELLAAAQYACDREVWDRCINTSERTKGEFDVAQRYPMPFRDAVVKRSGEIGLDPAYVYGLMRQESRFVMNARSGVGASGLMQVMPATARWTASKLGMRGFSPDQLTDRDTNIAIGTGYLKLVLDDFGGSMPLAAAAYNAGPSRPRNWRNGATVEGAAWAETVPFTETRDYVKKVVANATLYSAMLTGQPQSLKARLGTIGPRDSAQPEPNRDLP